MPRRIEKIAIARIFSDLIKADRIIDTGEMECWERICAKYEIGKDDRTDADTMPFADAIRTLRSSSDPGLSRDCLGDCRAMTVSDGFCAHSEALLLITLMMALDPAGDAEVEVISIPRANFNIDLATALYIENENDREINEEIRLNHRVIFKELQLAGFHFVYLPNIIEHYRQTDPQLFRRILSFLEPAISPDGIANIYNALMQMTTGEFCRDILCNKCGISDLRDTYPSLLIKIGNSFVGGLPYSNYLKIEVGSDIVKCVQKFVDEFCDLLSSDVYVVNTSEEKANQFHFHGFYKQLLDIFLVRKNIRSTILLDPYGGEVGFPEIDSRLKEIHRRERALYALLLCQGAEGLDFKAPRRHQEMAAHERRMQRISRRYGAIYEMFGGEPGHAPDLTIPEIRRPIVARLRRALQQLKGLYNPDDYNVSRSRDGLLTVNVEPDKILVAEFAKGGPVPLVESELYHRVKSI